MGGRRLAAGGRHPSPQPRDATGDGGDDPDRLAAFELGLGAGWFREEYDALGLPYPAPAARIRREGSLTDPEQRVVDALAWWEAAGIAPVSRLPGWMQPLARANPVTAAIDRVLREEGLHFDHGGGIITARWLIAQMYRAPDPAQ